MSNYTKTKAINAMCKSCIYDPLEKGTWHEQVEGCLLTDCALYVFRPITGKTKKELKEKEIATYTPEQLEAYRKKQEEARERLSK